MNEISLFIWVWLDGILLGVVFFGGLWWTIRNSLGSAHPALWFLTSLLVRAGIALSGFYYAADNDWRRLLFCLLGFMIARLIVTRLTRPKIRLV